MAKKKYIGKNVVDLESKFREDVYLEKLTSTTDTKKCLDSKNTLTTFLNTSDATQHVCVYRATVYL